MKLLAISIRQPWVWAILYAGKDVENRSRNSLHRGPVLLHASAGMTSAEYFEALASIEAMRSDHPRPSVPDRWRPAGVKPLPTTDISSLPLGGLCGIARVTGCKFLEDIAGGPTHIGWQIAGAFGLKLADVRPLPFIPMPGSRVVPFNAEPALEAVVKADPRMLRRVEQYRSAWRELGGS